MRGVSASPVVVTPLRRSARSLVLPLVVWVVVFGGRVVCRACQRTIPLVAVLLPLPLAETARFLHHRPR